MVRVAATVETGRGRSLVLPGARPVRQWIAILEAQPLDRSLWFWLAVRDHGAARVSIRSKMPPRLSHSGYIYSTWLGQPYPPSSTGTQSLEAGRNGRPYSRALLHDRSP